MPPLIVIVVNTADAATVMVAELVMLPEAAVITAEPAATPVTSPLPVTVATPGAFDDQVIVAAIGLPFWSFGEAVNCSVEPATTDEPPLMVIVVNTGVAVTEMVAELLTLPEAAVITAEPAATPVTSPLPLTVATLGAFDDQEIVAPIALPFWSFGDAVSCSVEPATTDVLPPMAIVVSTGVGVGVGVGDVGVLSLLPPEHPRRTAASVATMRDWRTVDMELVRRGGAPPDTSVSVSRGRELGPDHMAFE